MARRTGGRVSQSDVVRYRSAQGGRALPLGSVATVAIGGQRAAVVVIHMAQRAGHGGVRAGQRERGRAVIECRSRPICSRVADRTVRRETRRNVIRNRAAERRRAVPFRGVAAIASR